MLIQLGCFFLIIVLRTVIFTWRIYVNEAKGVYKIRVRECSIITATPRDKRVFVNCHRSPHYSSIALLETMKSIYIQLKFKFV